MSAAKYPVTFGYLAKWGTYTHRGEDRAMPTGTKIVINNLVIGLSGNTGKSSGPHLHLQCGKDMYAQTPIKPSNYWFKGDKIVETGTASEWGNYIIVKYGSVYCVYAHLSKIYAKKGDVLEYKGKTIKQWYDWGQTQKRYFAARKAQAIELEDKVAKLTSERNILDNQVQSLKKELADCQTAPEAPQDAVDPEVVPDTSEPEKPQEDTPTQATEGFWSWLINLIRR